MIRESDIGKLLDDLDHLLIAIGSGHRPALALIGKLRLDVLDMLAAAAPDEDEPDVSTLPDPEPVDDKRHRRNRKGVTYEQAMKYACPTCDAKRGQPCIQMRRRGDVPVEPFVEMKNAHDARKEKARSNA